MRDVGAKPDRSPRIAGVVDAAAGVARELKPPRTPNIAATTATVRWIHDRISMDRTLRVTS